MKKTIVTALISASLAVALWAADAASPHTLQEAKQTIAALLEENNALKAENAKLKARVEELEAKLAGEKTLTAKQQEFLAKLREVKGAIESAADEDVLCAIVEREKVELAALAAACGYYYGPFVCDKCSMMARVRTPKGFLGSAKETTETWGINRVTCKRPHGGQESQFPAKGTMDKKDWQSILDILAEWEKAAIE